MADAASRIQPDVKPNVISYSCTSGSIVIGEEKIMAEKIRENIPKINLKVNLKSTSASSQFKRADKSEAKIALILGAEELKNNTLSIKDLREESPQVTLSLESTIERLNGIFSI